MNKYQEALDGIVNTIIEEEADGYWEPRTAGDFCWKSRTILQELVDKETPKKPVEIQDDVFGDYHLVCPNCGQGAIVIATRTDGKLYPRCPFCGQKLEGENEDDQMENV